MCYGTIVEFLWWLILCCRARVVVSCPFGMLGQKPEKKMFFPFHLRCYLKRVLFDFYLFIFFVIHKVLSSTTHRYCVQRIIRNTNKHLKIKTMYYIILKRTAWRIRVILRVCKICRTNVIHLKLYPLTWRAVYIIITLYGWLLYSLFSR